MSGSGAFPEWGRAEALAQEPALLTGHHYPLGCAQTPPPSIESLLSALTRRREARSLSIYTAVARDNGIPFRMDETNSVSCGGVAGISNTFASALWATGYIAQAMAAGAAGVNLQGNPLNCTGYTPLCAYGPAAVASGELHAQPDWYALLLTRSLIGDRPLASTVLSGETPAADVLAQAFAAPGGALKIVICDDEPGGAPALRLHLDVGPGMARASLLPLTAPAQDATAGILLGGRAVGADGSWKPPAHLRQLPTRAGILDLRVESDTALLVSVSPRASGRHAPRKR